MSRPHRFFCPPEQIGQSHITILDEDAHHIATVLRMKPGAPLAISDGAGSDYSAIISRLTPSEIVLEITDRTARQRRPPLLTLCQGLPKSDKMDLIVQKATELGVVSIVPLVTERTIVKVKDEQKRLARWRRICREAAMQSNRSDIPILADIQTLGQYLGGLSDEQGELRLLPWEESSASLKKALRGQTAIQRILVLIGPEGGISRHEADLAAERGFIDISLGPNILRTETAGLAALSMLVYELFL